MQRKQQSLGFQKTTYLSGFGSLATRCQRSLQQHNTQMPQETANGQPQLMTNSSTSQHYSVYSWCSPRGNLYQQSRPPTLINEQHTPPIQQPSYMQQSSYVFSQTTEAANNCFNNHAHGNAPYASPRHAPPQGQWRAPPTGYLEYPAGGLAQQHFRLPPLHPSQHPVGSYGNVPNTAEGRSDDVILQQQTRITIESLQIMSLSDGNKQQRCATEEASTTGSYNIFSKGLQTYGNPSALNDDRNANNFLTYQRSSHKPHMDNKVGEKPKALQYKSASGSGCFEKMADAASEKRLSPKPKSDSFVFNCDETEIPAYKIEQRREKKIKDLLQRQESLKARQNSESSGGSKTFRKAAALSNRVNIINAVEYVLFPGPVHKDVRKKVLDKIDDSQSKRFLVLFRNNGCLFRALYCYDTVSDKISKLYGTGPAIVTEDMFYKFFKFSSHAKRFCEVYTNELGATVDAFTIHDSLWQPQKGQAKK